MARPFHFRLRTLFVVVTVVAVILGNQGLMVRPVRDIFCSGRIAYNEGSWWITPVAIDAAAISFGASFVLRKNRFS
jgi:hypothetical protein